MSIITDNYIWFIISGFVLLLITIGYYAEQTGFGKMKLNSNGKSDNLDNGDPNFVETITINDDVPVEEPLIIPDNVSSFEGDPNFGIPEIKKTSMNTGAFADNSIPEPTNLTNDENIWKF